MASGLTPRTVRTCESRMAAYRIWACPSRRIRNLRRGFCRSSRTCSVLVHSAPQQRRGPSLQFGENILLTLAISSLVRKLPVVWTEACAVNVNLVENNSKLEFQNQVVSEPEERAPRHARSVIHTRRSMTSSHSRFADGRLRGGGDEIITDPSPAVFPAHRGVRKCDRTLSSAQPIPETLRGACRGKVATSSDDTFPGESIASPSQPREHLGPSVPSLHSPCRQVYSAKPRADPPGTRLPRNERRGERQRRFGQTSRSKSSASVGSRRIRGSQPHHGGSAFSSR